MLRTVIVGTFAYTTLVIFLRISGKRTLAKLNAFDLVVTVALGSTLSAILLQESIALAEGATALAVLILLQYAVTCASVRSKAAANIFRSEPTLLLSNGFYCHDTMKRQRITEDEVKSAIRSSGTDNVQAISAVVLESDGTLSVIQN
ncbi:DUF421 domain-containing protein [Agrobacterium sp. B1(2019)]|nr:DUF421 domain-containing protein [Agrobacterium sp. B1(2019)]